MEVVRTGWRLLDDREIVERGDKHHLVRGDLEPVPPHYLGRTREDTGALIIRRATFIDTPETQAAGTQGSVADPTLPAESKDAPPPAFKWSDHWYAAKLAARGEDDSAGDNEWIGGCLLNLRRAVEALQSITGEVK